MINVFITEDHPLIINSITSLINNYSDMKVAGSALTAEDCRQAIGKVSPDILMLDINLPDKNGIDLCKEIHSHYPSIKIIALTGFKEHYYMQQMISSGASGYLLKSSTPDEIINAIRSVYSGETFLSEEVKEKMTSSKDSLYLTPREVELLRLVVEGYTNKEIASKLFLGVETVNSYRKNLLLKLGVKNTASMVKLALTEKLI
jgi:DNA-binding NarL/FixJ family response regulator